MSQTILTAGWPKPKGVCDICRAEPHATGSATPASRSCGGAACAAANQRNWEALEAEIAAEAKAREEW